MSIVLFMAGLAGGRERALLELCAPAGLLSALRFTAERDMSFVSSIILLRAFLMERFLSDTFFRALLLPLGIMSGRAANDTVFLLMTGVNSSTESKVAAPSGSGTTFVLLAVTMLFGRVDSTNS